MTVRDSLHRATGSCTLQGRVNGLSYSGQWLWANREILLVEDITGLWWSEKERAALHFYQNMQETTDERVTKYILTKFIYIVGEIDYIDKFVVHYQENLMCYINDKKSLHDIPPLVKFIKFKISIKYELKISKSPISVRNFRRFDIFFLKQIQDLHFYFIFYRSLQFVEKKNINDHSINQIVSFFF